MRRDFAHSAIECAARHPTELENTCTDLRQALDRSDLLEAVSTAWSKLDPDEYPFARSVAGQIRDHDDRVDFLSGIDLILNGIDAAKRRQR